MGAWEPAELSSIVICYWVSTRLSALSSLSYLSHSFQSPFPRSWVKLPASTWTHYLVLRPYHSHEDESRLCPESPGISPPACIRLVNLLVIWLASVPTLSPNYYISGYSYLPSSPQFSVELIAEATQNTTTSRESFKKP